MSSPLHSEESFLQQNGIDSLYPHLEPTPKDKTTLSAAAALPKVDRATTICLMIVRIAATVLAAVTVASFMGFLPVITVVPGLCALPLFWMTFRPLNDKPKEIY